MVLKLTKNNIKKNKLIPFIFLVSLIILIGFIKLFYPINHANLMRFRSLTASDPLFYDPNTNLEHLRASTQALRNQDEQVVRTNESYRKKQTNPNKWDVFSKDWGIWPDRFLMMLPAIHEITTDFLSKPTPEKASKLLDNYTQAVKQYGDGIASHIKALDTFLKRFPEYKTKKILFLGSATTPEIVRNDFLLIRKNAQALEKEIAERKKCLYKGICAPKKLKDQDLTQENAIAIPFKPLPDNVLAIDRSNDTVFGPFNIATGCFGFTDNQKVYSLPFSLVEKKNGDLIPMPTNIKYYHDFRKESQRYSKIWAKHGISILPHEPLTDYLCTDMRYLPQLFLDYLKEKRGADSSLSNENLFSTLPYLIDRTAKFGEYMIYDLAYAKKPYNPLYLLIDRSAYSLYFGTFTSRIWRIAQLPTFLINKNFSNIYGGYVKYEDLIAEGMSEEKIAGLNTNLNIAEVIKRELQEPTQSGQIKN